MNDFNKLEITALVVAAHLCGNKLNIVFNQTDVKTEIENLKIFLY